MTRFTREPAVLVCDEPLTGVDPKAASDADCADLELAAVYTALLTQRSEGERDGLALPGPEREARHLSAVEMLNTEPHLVLLGDPGSGKSTFVNFVALCLAGEALGEGRANVELLTAPLPRSCRSAHLPVDAGFQFIDRILHILRVAADVVHHGGGGLVSAGPVGG